MSKLTFVQLDVFTGVRYEGNPLAIVSAPSSSPLTQEQKQQIAREFNLSETVFVHDVVGPESSDSSLVFPIDIFTPNEELPFAGHPTIGTGSHLLKAHPNHQTVTLRTKAGDIPVVREPNGVRLRVPINFKVHDPYVHPNAKSSVIQPDLTEADYVNGPDAPEAVASIVKGMTFLLLELASEEALTRVKPYSERVLVPDEHLGEWKGFSSVYIFAVMEDGVTVRTRMFEGTFEDPATGSAASTLCGYLAKKKGPGEWKFRVVQGVEMGRRSEIGVNVSVNSGGEVQKIELIGNAVGVMGGFVEI
ncbi:phenazine biosynthesis PhzC/PhzF protein [Dendrothele bispora CBS 962.96]|uniref:Phenazine biosynthesis PhzC/PhzF protein n=1 Tax=Dendrothele bispora (strain CBS 962.96) TaxID=1314807 RepID=A0A4S8LDV6_DENBC|nr:phenazine biosynthesis PhzC/PhzF protein [Dendrothele bispora CBS 962.96]